MINDSPRKFYVVGGSKNYANWMGGKIVDSFDEANIIVYTGGEDITPSLYKEIPHPTTFSNIERDKEEIEVFNKAKEAGKHIIGICRGSQFLCVMAGGSLVQHQENPKYIHEINTFNEKKLWVNSTHHQAQYPWKLKKDKFKLLGWSLGVSNFHFNGEEKEIVNDIIDGGKEVEMVYYPEIKSLAIQSHPEMLLNDIDKYSEIKESITFCRFLLNSHLNNTL
jgi:hypothetical protein